MPDLEKKAEILQKNVAISGLNQTDRESESKHKIYKSFFFLRNHFGQHVQCTLEVLDSGNCTVERVRNVEDIGIDF